VTPRIFAMLVACAAGLSAGTGRAEAQTQAQCAAVLKQHAGAVSAGSDACLTLATMVATTSPAVTRASDLFLKGREVSVTDVFTPRDLQSRHPQQPATGGTPAQGEAVPDVRPAALASGTIAAVGTDAGTDAIAAISVNPSLLIIGDEVSRRLAQYSRFFDLTFFVPVSRTTAEAAPDVDGTPKYYGARLRLNINGVSSGGEVWDGAEELLKKWISQSADNTARVRDLLRGAPSLGECVAALMADPAPPAAAIESNCGAPFEIEVSLEDARQLREQFDRVRRAADSQYFGADIRFDKGDPTLGAVENASGTYLFAGVAYGRRLDAAADGASRYGFRARLGARHAKLDHIDEADYAMDGAIGFERARQIDTYEINASAAIEFRYGNGPSALRDQFQTDFAAFRASVLIPITALNSFSINVGVPFAGDVSPALGVNFNWGLLMSNTPNR
jgi:hypothetical protein